MLFSTLGGLEGVVRWCVSVQACECGEVHTHGHAVEARASS